MPSCGKQDPPYPHTPRLTLVVSTDPANKRASSGPSDWSMLMARAQDGDRDAYRSLLKEMEPYVRSIAIRCFNRPADAEDVVQDILLTVHAVRNTYDPERPFGPWLLAIANHRVIDRLRRHARQKAREIELSADHETFAGPPANLDNTTSAELAQASGRSVTALKVATHRAIRNLRRLLKGEPS